METAALTGTLTHNFTDKLYNTQNLSLYNLLLQTGNAGFTFCVTDAKKSRCLKLAHFSFDFDGNHFLWQQFMEEVLGSFPEIRAHTWASIRISYATSKFSLIPASLFNVQDTASYLPLLFNIAPSERVMYYPHKAGFVNVFAASADMVEWMEQLYSGIRLTHVHQSSTLAEAFLNNYSLAETDRDLLVQIEESHVIIIAKERKQLVLCNIYPTKSENEVAYFTLLAMQELGLNPKTDVVNLYGNVTRESSAFKGLRTYVQYVYFGEKPSFISYSNEFDALPVYRYFDVYGLHLCE